MVSTKYHGWIVQQHFLYFQIRMDYHTDVRDQMITNGAMHWQIHYVNDVSRPIRNENQVDEEHFRRMTKAKRWETRLRNIKYR